MQQFANGLFRRRRKTSHAEITHHEAKLIGSAQAAGRKPTSKADQITQVVAVTRPAPTYTIQIPKDNTTGTPWVILDLEHLIVFGVMPIKLRTTLSKTIAGLVNPLKDDRQLPDHLPPLSKMSHTGRLCLVSQP